MTEVGSRSIPPEIGNLILTQPQGNYPAASQLMTPIVFYARSLSGHEIENHFSLHIAINNLLCRSYVLCKITARVPEEITLELYFELAK